MPFTNPSNLFFDVVSGPLTELSGLVTSVSGLVIAITHWLNSEMQWVNAKTYDVLHSQFLPHTSNITHHPSYIIHHPSHIQPFTLSCCMIAYYAPGEGFCCTWFLPLYNKNSSLYPSWWGWSCCTSRSTAISLPFIYTSIKLYAYAHAGCRITEVTVLLWALI